MNNQFLTTEDMTRNLRRELSDLELAGHITEAQAVAFTEQLIALDRLLEDAGNLAEEAAYKRGF